MNETTEDSISESVDSYSEDDLIETGNVSETVPTSNSDNIDESTNFKDECVKRLQNDVMLRKLVENLNAEGNLYDFVMLIEQLASGELPANNIVLLLLLDRV